MNLQYLIDTDWVIHYLHAHLAIVARLDELHPQGLALSIVSLAELYEGVYIGWSFSFECLYLYDVPAELHKAPGVPQCGAPAWEAGEVWDVSGVFSE